IKELRTLGVWWSACVTHVCTPLSPKFPPADPQMATPKKPATGTCRSRWLACVQRQLRQARHAAPWSTKTLRDALRDYVQKVSPTKRGELWELKRLRAFEGSDH